MAEEKTTKKKIQKAAESKAKNVEKKVKNTAIKKTPVKDATKKQAKSEHKSTVEKSVVTKNKSVKKESINKPYVPNYRQLYETKIVPSLMKKFNYSSVMEVPKLVKITLNMGIGDAKLNSKALESAVNELTVIAGQKAVTTTAKKDVSNFKIRRGFPVGCTVNMQGNRMYEFFERLNSIALPRTRDFTGLSFKSFDKRGNYNFGIKEQIVFTEIDYDKIDAIRGLDVAITTSAKTDAEAYELLKEFGFPLREKPIKNNDAVEAT